MNVIAKKGIQSEHLYLWATGILLLALTALYIYLLSATVIHVVMQKQYGSDIHEINSEIAKLEAEYINKQHAMSNEIATMTGFISVAEKVFINKSESSLVLSTNNF